VIHPRSAETRLAAYYFAHFATVGTLVPYVALWLSGLGHEPGWIGAVVAAPSLLMLATTVALGSWADRLADRRTAILLANWLTLGLLSLWLLDTGPVAIVLVWTLSGVLIMAKQPVMDAAALALTARENIPYGRVRAFGSIGFIVALLVCGQLFEGDNVQRFLPMVLVVATCRVLASHALPRLRTASGPALELPLGAGAVADRRPALLRHPGFLAVLAGSALINASHAFYYTFGLLHWKDLGIATTTGSLLWGVAIVAEVGLMWRFAGVARRLSPRHCLLLAASLGALRWPLMLASSLPVLLIAQALHAATFGLTFLATVNFIARRVDEAYAARAQSVLAILSTGSLAVATVVSGRLYERVGGQGYLSMMLLALAGLVLVAWSYRSDLDDVA